VGATTSTFPYSRKMQSYLHATGRGPVARAADAAAAQGFLSADEGAEYDEVIEIVSISSFLIMAFRTKGLYRTFPNLSPPSMDHLRQTLLHHSPNSARLSRNKAGRMSCLLG